MSGNNPNPFANIVIGGVAGVVSRTATAPLELYKIQRQSTHIVETSLYKVYKDEGIRGLWKGNGVNSLRLFPHIGINFSIYSMCKTASFFDNHNRYHHFIAGCRHLLLDMQIGNDLIIARLTSKTVLILSFVFTALVFLI